METRKVCENCLHWTPCDGYAVQGTCGISSDTVKEHETMTSMRAVASDGGHGVLETGAHASCHRWEQAEA